MSGRGNPEPDIPIDQRPCGEVKFDADLIRVDLEVAATVRVGSIVVVRLIEERYPAAVADAGPLGYIASGILGRLVQCLREGVGFEGTVLELDGAFVKIRVAPR